MTPAPLWLLILAVPLAAAGCRGPAPPSLVRIAHESDLISFDPAAADAASHSILSNIYEPLAAFDKDMALVPVLAVNWSTLDDATWLLELRKGVRFHDGEPLTAEDVKRTIERARDNPGSVAKRHVATIRDVEIVDERHLKLRTARRDPLLLNRLAFVLIDRQTPGRGGAARLVGTGPYRFVRWEKGRVLEAEAFGDYWRGRPAIDRVRFVPVEEGERSIEVLKRGEVDVLRWVPETLADRLRRAPGVRLVSRTGLAMYYLWTNTGPWPKGRNPFADKRVRHAISLAIDRRAIIARLGGHGLPAHQLVLPGVFGYVASLPEPYFDPAASRRLLLEAGYPHGFETELVHRSGASVTAVAVTVRDMLAAVGIRAILKTPDWPVVVAEWRAGRLPFFLAGWRFESGDAYAFLVDCVVTRDVARNHGGNNAGFSSPVLDAQVEALTEIFGEARRLKHYEKLMRTAMDEMPLIPLYARSNLYGVSERVTWEPRLDGALLAAEMSLTPPR